MRREFGEGLRREGGRGGHREKVEAPSGPVNQDSYGLPWGACLLCVVGGWRGARSHTRQKQTVVAAPGDEFLSSALAGRPTDWQMMQ